METGRNPIAKMTVNTMPHEILSIISEGNRQIAFELLSYRYPSLINSPYTWSYFTLLTIEDTEKEIARLEAYCNINPDATLQDFLLHEQARKVKRLIAQPYERPNKGPGKRWNTYTRFGIPQKWESLSVEPISDTECRVVKAFGAKGRGWYRRDVNSVEISKIDGILNMIFDAGTIEYNDGWLVAAWISTSPSTGRLIWKTPHYKSEAWVNFEDSVGETL